MRLTLPGVLAALFAAALFAAPAVADDKKDDKKADKVKETEKKLLGKWKLVKSDMGDVGDESKFFIVYKEKGEMEFVREAGEEKPMVFKGKYKVTDADKVDWTVEEFGQERGEVSTVKELSDKKLIIEDPQGVKEEFEKVVEKKKEEKKDK
ncbi:MAG: hypothetical protein ABGY75_14255 [Gemmataceae bacterium]